MPRVSRSHSSLKLGCWPPLSLPGRLEGDGLAQPWSYQLGQAFAQGLLGHFRKRLDYRVSKPTGRGNSPPNICREFLTFTFHPTAPQGHLGSLPDTGDWQLEAPPPPSSHPLWAGSLVFRPGLAGGAVPLLSHSSY